MTSRMRYVARLFAILVIAVFALGVAACSAGSRPDGFPVARNELILLAPNISAGSVGWCIVTSNISSNGGYCPTGRPIEPIIVQSWSGGKLPSVTEAYAVTLHQVASVSFHGRRVATHPEPGLPDGLRVVAVEVRGLYAPRVRHYFIARNAHGEQLPARFALTGPMFEFLPTKPARDSPNNLEVCRLEADSLDGVRIGEGTVVAHVRPYGGQVSGGFLSCASRFYELQRVSLTAAVLLSAEHPGSQPEPLPAMRPLSGHPGMFQAPGFEGDIVARRIHGAWLVVGKGETVGQRVSFLEHLHATVELQVRVGVPNQTYHRPSPGSAPMA